EVKVRDRLKSRRGSGGKEGIMNVNAQGEVLHLVRFRKVTSIPVLDFKSEVETWEKVCTLDEAMAVAKTHTEENYPCYWEVIR
ncbi:MAG: hypothetical protein Q4A79_01785, partial [Candidatus Saccharibacteria bacterium]|nr:hypothetical protein [Candidatus Saccharibacteria bacterium]